MAHPKELYKGTCLDDLEQYYQLPDIKKSKLPMLLNTAQKVYMQAEKCRLEGDEELSYIYFMKYFNLIDHIRKMPDYSQQKQYVSKLLGHTATLTSIMDKAEALSISLKKRYGQLKPKSKTVNNTNNLSHRKYESSPDNSDTSDDNMDEKLLRCVSCVELFKMMKDRKTSLLIMDCRPENDFSKSKLVYQYCVNVPEEIILPGMSAGKIQQQLESSSKALWSSRTIKDHVVLMDWNSKGPEPLLNTPIWRLRDILLNWDPDVVYRSPIKILQGGYETFVLMYPMECTNPNVQAPLPIDSEMEILDDIEYPSINDITMKDDVKFETPHSSRDALGYQKPNIDRKSKVAAMKTYDEKQKLFEILQEQELLLEKALENDKKRLAAENDWKAVANQVTEAPSEDQKSVLLTREQELLYNIMQLESNERDYKLENERLREQLDEYKRREQEIGETTSEKEAVEETTKRIEEKSKERNVLDKEREKYTQEREKQLALAREQKRHLKSPIDEEISKPKIPQFDRSIKPLKVHIETSENSIQRDFAPVLGTSVDSNESMFDNYKRIEKITHKSWKEESMHSMINYNNSFYGRGLTGLKNLGNTCYMNSIMQCLSNTTALAEYFIIHSYKKHINRSNKTQGRIVEEVAALIKVLWNGHYKCIASKDLRYVVGQYQQIFRGIEQQDSHEFLTILMDWLHSDLQTLQIAESPRRNLPPSEKAWFEFTKSCESLILRLFYGQIKSTVKCRECHKESATYECFSNLSLELPQTNNRCVLNDCLNMYFNGERILGWNCPNCKEKREAIKKLDISKLPPILVIHFKRFYADPDAIGNTYKKKQNYVSFPLVNLNMTSYTARSEMRLGGHKTYHLYGISNHYGTMEGGHYTAFCKNSVYSKWFKFDDQIVSSMDPSDVVSSAAYILFYSCLPEAPPADVM